MIVKMQEEMWQIKANGKKFHYAIMSDLLTWYNVKWKPNEFLCIQFSWYWIMINNI